MNVTVSLTVQVTLIDAQGRPESIQCFYFTLVIRIIQCHAPEKGLVACSISLLCVLMLF
jgi:hypothetical protein